MERGKVTGVPRSRRLGAIAVLMMMALGPLTGVLATDADSGGVDAVEGGMVDTPQAAASRGARSVVQMPDEGQFQDPPNENRVLPIHMGSVNDSILQMYEDLEVGGIVMNSWKWTDADLQQARANNWTLWANDYYMYPSGNANPFGGVQETFWNPGFEVDSLGLWPDGWVWTYYDWPRYDRTGANAHSGTSAVAVDNRNLFYWALGVEEGWEYNISVWAKGDTGSEYGAVVVFWADVDVELDVDAVAFQTGPGYERYSLQAQAPPGANVARILLLGVETSKYVWFDDAMVRRAGQLDDNDLVNGDLEADLDTNGHPDGWTPQGTASWDGTGAWSHSGLGAVRVNLTNNYLQALPTQKGTDYYVGEWTRSEAGPVLAQLAIIWVNDTWDLVGVDQMIFMVDTAYSYHDMVVTAPMNSTFAVIALITASLSYIFIDDVNLAPLSPLNNGVSRGPVLDGHPELEAQGLYYASEDVVSPAASGLSLPHGEPVSIVATRVGAGGALDLGTTVDLSGSVVGGRVVWTPPSGTWRVMAFTVDILYNGTEVDPAITNMHQINVMNKVAVQRFIEEMYEKTIYDETSEHFGDMIVASFTDEVSDLAGYFLRGQEYPVVAWLQDDVNGLYITDEFEALHGYDLISVLPALWNDVGPRTAVHRVDFYNTTAYLQGEAYYRMIGEWCEDHGINFSGHLLAEDSLIHHTAFYGDFFESIKHMGYPGMDTLLHSAGTLEHDLIVPKLVSSAAVLYGKPHAMTEYSVSATSMNYRNMTAVVNWEAVQGIDIVTSFSFLTGLIPDEELRAHSLHVGRTNYMLQQGDYTTDIAVLYPITTMQAEYVPSTEVIWNRDRFGGFEHDESFKNVTLELLTGQLDFIYINDESLGLGWMDTSGDRTAIRHDTSGLGLEVLVLPEMDAIRTATMETVGDFYDAGGIVVAVGDLPTASAENGTDPYISDLVDHIFDTGPIGVEGFNRRTNAAGGVSIVADGDPGVLMAPMREALDVDLVMEGGGDPYIYYQRRTAPGFDLFYLVNNRISDVTATYRFKAYGDVSAWNPETGVVMALAPSDYSYDPATGYTTIQDALVKGFSSIFLLFKRPVLEVLPEDVVLSPPGALVGDIVTIDVNVTNIGHGVAAQAAIGVYDGHPDVGGALVAPVETATFAPQGTRDFSFEWDTAASPGMRSITIEACLEDGTCTYLTVTYYVNTPPVANITVDRTEALTLETFVLSANGSWDLDGPLANQSWDLGDGSNATGPVVEHSYSDDGVYTVELVVVDSNGTEASSSVNVTVLNRAPTASLTAEPVSGNSSTAFLFNASASSDMDGVGLTYLLDLGDGTDSTEAVVVHTYGRPGNYTVTLAVTDDDGAHANASIDVAVSNLGPMAGFTVEPAGGDVGTEFVFNSTSFDPDGDIVAHNWSLGDGTYGVGSSVTHRYMDDGSYTVTLSVMDENGNWSAPFSREVVVANLGPEARIAVGDGWGGRVGDELRLDAGAGTTDPDDPLTALSFEWDLGDGNPKVAGASITHVFTKAGNFTVTLTVMDDDGATSVATVQIDVEEKEKVEPADGTDMTILMAIAAVVIVLVVLTIVFLILARSKVGRGEEEGGPAAERKGPEEERVEEGPADAPDDGDDDVPEDEGPMDDGMTTSEEVRKDG